MQTAVPMVAIAGQVRLDPVHGESHRYVDVVGMPRPAIVTGSGAIRAGASPDLRALCALDDRSPPSPPAVGPQARDPMAAGLDAADVVVCVGHDVVDPRPADIPELQVVATADAPDAPRDEPPAGEEPAFATRLRVSVNAEPRAPAERPGMVGPQAATAAAPARPDVRVVSVSGDGGLMTNAQGMETATRPGPPVNWSARSGGVTATPPTAPPRHPGGAGAGGVGYPGPSTRSAASSATALVANPPAPRPSPV